MFPVFSAFNHGYVRRAYVEHNPQFFLSQLALSNEQNFGFSQLGPRTLLSCWYQFSFKSLSHVVGSSPWMKMSRLNTNRSIAMMEDVHSIRNRSVIDPIRGLVCTDYFKFSVYSHRELAIPINIGRSTPVPTPFGERRGRRRLSWHEPAKRVSLRESFRSFGPLSCKRISVLFPPFVVGGAPSSGPDGLLAKRAGFHKKGGYQKW